MWLQVLKMNEPQKRKESSNTGFYNFKEEIPTNVIYK